MKQATIHYFTGTGNTAAVVDLLAQGLYMAGWRVQEVSVPPSIHNPLADGMHIFAFPVHAFSLPQLMRKYVKSLPQAAGQAAAAVAVVGELSAIAKRHGFEGQALAEAQRLLAAKGFQVVLTDIVGHVANFTQAIQPPEPREHAGIAEFARRQVESITQRLVDGKPSMRPCGWFTTAWSFVLGRFYRTIGRRVLAKLFAADSKCDGCGRCATRCPVQAIQMVHRRPRWSTACQACQRCINICPQRAIQTSALRLALFIAAAFLPYAAWVSDLLPTSWLLQIEPALPALNIAMWLGGYVLAVVVVDRLLTALDAVPWMRGMIGFGHTRDFRRYIEPHFKEKL